jgi:hypothetical protein
MVTRFRIGFDGILLATLSMVAAYGAAGIFGVAYTIAATAVSTGSRTILVF